MLYDVTTLYFEAEKEDADSGANQGLRKVRYSTERRVDPQIVVALLVDRSGFPLEIGGFEGNKAETKALLSIVEGIQRRHGLDSLVVVADAGMLSAENLKTLDAAGFKFIVGAWQTKALHDLESHFHWHGDYFAHGQVIDTITPQARQREGQQQAVQSGTRVESYDE
ncbi:MAG: transposase [Varibaculum cambriense]|nr:transposase [Varibaculum cambriense]MDU1223834.1 transposase [Varibaculum cambriense]